MPPKGVKARLFDTTSAGIDEAVNFAAGWNHDGWNAYVGVHPRKPETVRTKAASKEDVAIAFYIFADFDSQEAVDKLHQFQNDDTADGLKPTFGVVTGRTPTVRCHAYWALEEPVRNLASWTNVQAGIADFFGSDRVIDPPRIMRLAGSVSFPSAKKTGLGYVPESVSLKTNSDCEPVLLETLRQQFSAQKKTSRKPTAAANNGGDTPWAPARLDISAAVAEIKAGKNLHNNALALAASYAARAWSADWIHRRLRKLLEPVSNGGTLDKLPGLIRTAIEKFGFEAGDAGVVDLTEDGIATAFAERYRDRLRYDHDRGRWLDWSGAHWREDTTALAFARARNLGRELGADQKPGTRQRLGKAATAAAVIRLAESDRMFARTSSDWDSDPWLLGTPSGPVDLKTGELLAPLQHQGITKITAVAPDPDAGCPNWLAFLDQTTDGDAEYIEFLAVMSGYALTGDISEHALFYIHGDGGNGKSVFLNTLSGLLGDYAKAASMDTFVASRGERHPTELAMLRGARMVHASETEQGRAWAENRIKALTGGDPIAARFMRMDFFEYLPQFKLIIVGNHAPVLNNIDVAARRRFNILPFNNKPENPDKHLESKLRSEWPGILHWAIQGCLRWQADGLTRPDVVVGATRDYFDSQDVFGQWLDEECETGVNCWALTSALFDAWSYYAKSADAPIGSRKSFGNTLTKRGMREDRRRTGRGFKGVKLSEHRRPDPDHDYF
jgi:putative DNA primase/helicase